MAFQPRHKCGFGINEVVEVVPGAIGSDGAPIGYTFTIEGKPAESVLRFQDGPYVPATPPNSASAGRRNFWCLWHDVHGQRHYSRGGARRNWRSP